MKGGAPLNMLTPHAWDSHRENVPWASLFRPFLPAPHPAASGLATPLRARQPSRTGALAPLPTPGCRRAKAKTSAIRTVQMVSS